jgi:hypothetical protein
MFDILDGGIERYYEFCRSAGHNQTVFYARTIEEAIEMATLLQAQLLASEQLAIPSIMKMVRSFERIKIVSDKDAD